MQLLIHIPKGARSLDTEDIIYCKAKNKNTEIYLNSLSKNIKDKKYFVATKLLKDIEEDFPKPEFYRCHKSYFINFKYFFEFEVCTNSIIMTDGTKINISKTKRIESKKQLFEYYEKWNSKN